MRGCDMAQSPRTALQPDAAPREVLLEFECSLPSEVARVSSFVDQLMPVITRFRGTDGSELDIEIALREALSNAVIHGNRENPYKRVHVTVRCSADGEVSITVRDEGAGFDSDSIADPTAPENLFSTDGRGIYLMRALMDEVSFEEGGTVVYMCKKPISPCTPVSSAARGPSSSLDASSPTSLLLNPQ